MRPLERPPLVAHILYRFNIGGLENGVVNLINHMPVDRFRHVVIALESTDPAFCQRVQRPDVAFIALNKPRGHGVRIYPELYRLLRRLRPSIVHNRNLAALEMAVPAWAARVPVRIHGEHGWDTSDVDGSSKKYRFLRRLYSPFVTHYIALSGQLSAYLADGVGIEAQRISRICNGVDTARFPAALERLVPDDAPAGFFRDDTLVFGAVGRLQSVKDQLTLVRAFACWRDSGSAHARHARLMIVGDGPLRAQVEAEVAAAALGDDVWLTGARDDVPALMQAMDCFVLPSQAEGISNTLLEAMSCGLPVIATSVGGNSELVADNETGSLVPPSDPVAMASAMQRMAVDTAQRRAMSVAARARIEKTFSLDAMVTNYMAVYDKMLAAAGLSAQDV